jgi:predicted DNA-binding ribbon-helix-helix protein
LHNVIKCDILCFHPFSTTKERTMPRKPAKDFTRITSATMSANISPDLHELLERNNAEYDTNTSSTMRLALLEYLEQPLQARLSHKPNLHQLQELFPEAPKPVRSRSVTFAMTSASTREELAILAEHEGTTLSAVMRRALLCHLTNAFSNLEKAKIDPHAVSPTVLMDAWGDRDVQTR